MKKKNPCLNSVIGLITLILNVVTVEGVAENAPKNQTKPDELGRFDENIHGFFQLGTDHVWRGISFTSHSPTLLRPLFLALYKATSAASIRSLALVACCGKSANPKDKVTLGKGVL